MSVNTITDKVVKNLRKDPSVAFDPTIIIVISEIIMQVIEYIQECQDTPEEGLEVVKDPSWLQKRLLTIMIRRNLGWKANRIYGNDIYDALIDGGKEVTVEELQEAYLDM